MNTSNSFDRHKVVVLKVTEEDIEGLLLNHDLNDDGNYSYMEREFIDAVMRYLPEYAMGDDPVPKDIIDLVPYLKETAKSVVKIKRIAEIKKCIDENVPYDQWDKKILDIYSSKGIFSELILHFLLRAIHNTTPLISKIYFKDSFAHEAHGFDSVHVSDDNRLWLGETKFYNDSKLGINALIDDLNDYSNIKGRAGRLMEHYVGRIINLHSPPQNEETHVDFPFFEQNPIATEVLVNLDESEIKDINNNIARYKEFREKDPVLQEILIRNGVSIEGQEAILQKLFADLAIPAQREGFTVRLLGKKETVKMKQQANHGIQILEVNGQAVEIQKGAYKTLLGEGLLARMFTCFNTPLSMVDYFSEMEKHFSSQ